MADGNRHQLDNCTINIKERPLNIGLPNHSVHDAIKPERERGTFRIDLRPLRTATKVKKYYKNQIEITRLSVFAGSREMEYSTSLRSQDKVIVRPILKTRKLLVPVWDGRWDEGSAPNAYLISHEWIAAEAGVAVTLSHLGRPAFAPWP